MLPVRDHILRTPVLEQCFSTQSGFAPLPRACLSVNADISGRLVRVGARDATKPPTVCKAALTSHNKELSGPIQRGAEIENPHLEQTVV